MHHRGAVEGRDGFHLIGHLITLGGLTLPNLETYEQLYPVRFHRQELRCDSAGPGRFRGGAGCDYEVEIFTPADYAFRGEGVGVPSSFGAAGVSDDELWKIVAFLKRLPAVTPEEYKAWTAQP